MRDMGSKTFYRWVQGQKKPPDPCFMAPNLIFYLVNQTAKTIHLWVGEGNLEKEDSN